MPRSLVLAIAAIAFATVSAHAQAPDSDSLIAGAVQAAPADQRGTATVLGRNAQGTVTTLREGTGTLVCLADDPARPGFAVSCYHKDLEPFMARGRALTAEGLAGKEREDRRWKEIQAGSLPMPREPRLLTVVEGSGFDPASGTVSNPYTRWVIYTPFASSESTGLPTMPGPGAPWLMFPGTPGAHIMISPKRDAKQP